MTRRTIAAVILAALAGAATVWLTVASPLALARVLLAASIVLTVWFVLSLGDPRRSESPTVAWLLAGWGWVTAAFESLILLSMFRIHIPLWVGVVVLLAQDVIFAWRLVLQRRSRRADAAQTEAE